MKPQPKIGLLSKKNILVTLLLLTVVAFAAIWLYQGVRQTEVSLGADQRIDLTPQQIQSIKDIGQWEFLSVSDEQLVDTTRRGIFSDDHLVRIYYGTMRLGIDMRQLETGWIQREGDSLTIILPSIGLLDRDFIDEARTRSFHERGRWTAQDREALLKRAYQRMLQHGMTDQNIESARQNGEALFRQMMRSMGFEHVHIQWTK